MAREHGGWRRRHEKRKTSLISPVLSSCTAAKNPDINPLGQTPGLLVAALQLAASQKPAYDEQACCVVV